MALQEKLGKKIGPFPVGVWLIIVVAGVGIGWYFTRGSAAEPVDGGDEDFSGDPMAGESGTGAVGGWDVNQPWIPNVPPVHKGGTTITLDQWYKKALTRVVMTKTDPLLAQSALHNYIKKKPVSEKQVKVIEQAIHLVGPPPIFLPVIRKPSSGGGGGHHNGHHPGPNPGPTSGAQYTIKPADTLHKIAAKFYNGRLDEKATLIYHANKQGEKRPGMSPGFMDNRHNLPAGKKLFIPHPDKHHHSQDPPHQPHHPKKQTQGS